jgi:hypothetical protein
MCLAGFLFLKAMHCESQGLQEAVEAPEAQRPPRIPRNRRVGLWDSGEKNGVELAGTSERDILVRDVWPKRVDSVLL